MIIAKSLVGVHTHTDSLAINKIINIKSAEILPVEI